MKSGNAELQSAARIALAEKFYEVRRYTARLAEPLSAEDCGAQSMPDASPVKWHLAHTTWFFETFILEKLEPGFQAFQPAFRMLFNSYYNGVGEKHVRAHRGLLTRPSLDEVLDYRQDVDARMNRLIAQHDPGTSGEIFRLVTLGLHHEQQHQELLLTDVKHLLWMNPLKPAMLDAAYPLSGEEMPLRWKACVRRRYRGDRFSRHGLLLRQRNAAPSPVHGSV
jgi:hypothetical protein